MSPKLDSQNRSFYESYCDDFDRHAAAAQEAKALVESILIPYAFDLHAITGRAKKQHSTLVKLRRKSYSDPFHDLTDQVGVRVITYYADQVDPAVDALRRELNVDEDRSEDKRKELDVRSFGYRSVHLVARPSFAIVGSSLDGRFFEIQVRSILEHAWAEIEHEIVYKARIQQPDRVIRGFSSLAASLESADAAFIALRQQRHVLIGEYGAMYEDGKELDVELDSARLLAALEVFYPDGLSWRAAEASGRRFAARLDVACTDAMLDLGLRTAADVKAALASQPVKKILDKAAAASGLTSSSLPHLTVAAVVCYATDAELVRSDYPELLQVISAIG